MKHHILVTLMAAVTIAGCGGGSSSSGGGSNIVNYCITVTEVPSQFLPTPYTYEYKNICDFVVNLAIYFKITGSISSSHTLAANESIEEFTIVGLEESIACRAPSVPFTKKVDDLDYVGDCT